MRNKALAAFAAIKLSALAVLWFLAPHFDSSLERTIHRWDAQWYARIARDGYGFINTASDGRALSDYAFFPVYPMLERIIHSITGLSVIHSGVLVSVIASIFAAAAIFEITKNFKSPRVAFYTVIIWAALPIASVQTLAYSESLFTAFAAWSLLCVIRKKWLAASLLAAIAGATRPTGIAVAAAVMIAIVLYSRNHRVKPDVIASFLIAPIGWTGYILWVDSQLPVGSSYFTVAQDWGNSVDGGAAFIQWVSDFFADGNFLAGLGILVGVVALLASLVALIKSNAPAPLVIYSVIISTLALITSGYFGSKPRYLLPVFPLLIPIASWISHHAKSRRLAISISLIAICLAYGTLWLTGSGPL